MSPSRTRKQFVPSRPRSEIITAVAVGLGVRIKRLGRGLEEKLLCTNAARLLGLNPQTLSP